MLVLILVMILKVLNLGIVPSVEPTNIVVSNEDVEWREFNDIAYAEYLDIFDAMYENVEYKVSKNGRSMTKGTYSRSFKFI